MLTTSNDLASGSPLPDASAPVRWPALAHTPYTTGSGYVTPLPRTEMERGLWRLLVSLYPYTTERKIIEDATMRHRASEATSAGAAATATAAAQSTSKMTTTGKSTTCFMAGSGGVSSISDSGGVGGARDAELAEAMSHLLGPFERALTAASASTSTTTSASAPCVVSGSFVDVLLQHPFLPLRHALLESTVPFMACFSFAFCAPVAVCAATGDVWALRLLHTHCGGHNSNISSNNNGRILHRIGIDPNTAHPLLVAVRHGQTAALSEMVALASRSDGLLSALKPNLGSAFAEAVRLGSVAAAAILAACPAVNVNRFANNRGTCALLTACRAFISASQRVAALETALSQRAGTVTAVGGGHGGARLLPLPPRRSSSPQPPHTLPGSASFSTAMALVSNGVGGGGGAPALSIGLTPARGPKRRPASRESLSDGADADTAATCGNSARNSFSQQLRAAERELAQCHELVSLLLSLPSIDVNVGFYRTPLQLATRYRCAELVMLLVLHPKLRPNRGPRPAIALGESLATLRHTTLSSSALRAVIEPPMTDAVRSGSVECFALLLRHGKTTVNGALLEELERDPRDLTRVPFLESLAESRAVGWEGWAWRWRRRCAAAAALSGVALFVLNAVLLFGFPQEVGSLQWALLFAYVAALVPTLLCSRRHRYTVPAATVDELAARPGVVVAAARISSLPFATLDIPVNPAPISTPSASSSLSVSPAVAMAASSAAAAAATSTLAGTVRLSSTATVTLQLIALTANEVPFCGWFHVCGGRTMTARLLGLVLILTPGAPLVELFSLWMLLTYFTRRGALAERHYNYTQNRWFGSGGGSVTASRMALRLLRHPPSAESVVLVSSAASEEEERRAAMVLQSRHPTPLRLRQQQQHQVNMLERGPIPLFLDGQNATVDGGHKAPDTDDVDKESEHEMMVEEAGRKVFMHDADTIGDQFPFQMRRALQNQKQQLQLRSHGSVLRAADNASATTGMIAAHSTYYNHYLQTVLTPGPADLSTIAGSSVTAAPAAADGSDETPHIARMYVRSLAYLTMELVVPSRLVVCVVAFFVHLVTVFPEGGAGSDSAAATVVAACGLFCSVISGGALMTLWLALRHASPTSVLSGRRRVTGEDSQAGAFQEYLL